MVEALGAVNGGRVGVLLKAVHFEAFGTKGVEAGQDPGIDVAVETQGTLEIQFRRRRVRSSSHFQCGGTEDRLSGIQLATYSIHVGR